MPLLGRPSYVLHPSPSDGAPARRSRAPGPEHATPLAAEPGPSTITPDSIVAMPLGLRRRDILVGTGCLALAVGVGLLTAWQELGFLATLGLTLAGGAALGRVLLPRHDLKVAYLAVLAMAMAWSGVIFGHRPLVIAFTPATRLAQVAADTPQPIVDPSGFTTNIDLIAHGTVGTGKSRRHFSVAPVVASNAPDGPIVAWALCSDGATDCSVELAHVPPLLLATGGYGHDAARERIVELTRERSLSVNPGAPLLPWHDTAVTLQADLRLLAGSFALAWLAWMLIVRRPRERWHSAL